jgi:photosystem II stability/assembly factor-like uncharacterized protein
LFDREEMMPGRTSRFQLTIAMVVAFAVGSHRSNADEPVGHDAAQLEYRNVIRQDAQLNDVFFTDNRRGWAVGDHGVILRTLDGGRHWAMQQSPVDCPLNSVFFLSATTGWAAGGYTDPYTHTTHGVLLRSDDGGVNWVRWKRALLPSLLEVKFVSPNEGWAIGQTSDLFPHALFTTDDAGRTWTPAPMAENQVWLAGDFLGLRRGAVAGQRGALGVVRDRTVSPSRPGYSTSRSLRGLVMNPPGHGCAAGDGGLVLTTADGGETWTDRSDALPGGLQTWYDFCAVASDGSRLWVAGMPGTHVFRSDDGGQRWTASPTGQPLPIRALHFVDAQAGWAVGVLGTIIATSDGGKTWRGQRQGGSRAAWLGVFARPEDVPLEMIAQLSTAEGYLGAVEVIGQRDENAIVPATAGGSERVREALVAAGASHAGQAWRFPLPEPSWTLSADQIVKRWDAVNGQAGLQHLYTYLVRQIRMWRPEVLVTMSANPQGDQPLSHLVNQAVLLAVDAAAIDADGVDQLGLSPWRVKKVYVALPPRSPGTVSITATQLIPALGRSVAEHVARPRGLLHEKYVEPPPVTRFALLLNQLPQGQGVRDFFSGLSLDHGGGARRGRMPALPASLGQLKRSASRQQTLRAIIASASSGTRPPEAMLGQIKGLISAVDPESAADLLLHLAQRFREAGHWSLAAETYELLVDDYPGSPQAVAALTWLVLYNASTELAHVRRERANAVRQVRAEVHEIRPNDVTFPEAQPTRPVPAEPSTPNTLVRAASWGKQLQIADYMAYSRPHVRMVLASAHRRSGQERQAQRLYLALQRSRNRDAWWRCAAAEQWLIEDTPGGHGAGKDPLSESLATCRRVAEKPRLDGLLDDPCWKPGKDAEVGGAQAGMRLREAHSGGLAAPATFLLAYDDEYLFLGAVCVKAPGDHYAPGSGPRLRDAVPQSHDKIDLLLDVDRDRATYYRFTIDYRGWTSEACGNSTTWNPEWYVAASQHANHWICEAAIPLNQLVATPPASTDTWAIGIQRTLPGIGLQSWTRPASTDIMPEGFGYLKFRGGVE